MYINLLNLVVTLFWTCCDLDRNHARAIVHRRDVSAAVWGAVHSVPAALSLSLSAVCLGRSRCTGRRGSRRTSAVERLVRT